MISAKLSSRILFVGTDPDGKGGIASVIKSCSREVENFRYVCSHRFAGRLSQLWLAFSAAFKTAWMCAFDGIELVHIHTASYRAFLRESIYLLIAKAFRKKVVLQLHGGEFEIFYGRHPRYCNYICRKADCLVGVSEYFGDMFRRLGLNNNVVVVYNAVDKVLFDKLPNDNGIVRVLFMGAIDHNKGIFDVLECFSRNRDQLKGLVTLDICGVGEEDKLLKMIAVGGLKEFVFYRGWIDGEGKHSLLASSDIYIQPSYFESFGIAIVEAMSYGIPVIASETGGIPEIVRHGINGFLINPGDMERFLENLLRLTADAGLRKEMKGPCLATAALFTSANMERELTKLYENLLSE